MNYRSLSDYGIIGNLKTIALVSIDGSIDFMCFPDFDSPSVFLSMLDSKKGGYFKISPLIEDYNLKQMYLPDTNVLLTRFLHASGLCEIMDFMPAEETDGENMLIRRLTCTHGKIKFRITCAPRFNYAESAHTTIKENNIVYFRSSGEDGTRIRVTSSINLEIKDNDIITEFELDRGDKADFILEIENGNNGEINNIHEYVENSLYRTINYWKNWVEGSIYRGHWAENVSRSFLTLKLLTHRNGAIIASPTFGIPENIGGIKNWDYRYVWIRDASFFIYSMIKYGYLKEATMFFKWLQTKCEGIKKPGKLGLMYTINGKEVEDERELKHLEGYQKSKPVVIGNNANKQIQLDIYGELIDAVYLYNKYVEHISWEFWQDISAQLSWLSKNWRMGDEGIWEVRGGKRKFLYSRLMCWVAFDRAIKIAEGRSFPYPEEWKSTRNEIFYSIYSEFWNCEKQSFMQFSGADTVDASTLLMPIMFFISPRDPMWISTLKAIEDHLVTDSLVYRYRHNEEVTGLKGGEGTFGMCTFWYIECLTREGKLQKARMFLEKMFGYANHLGIYSEMISRKGELLGNFPQALTHLGLIDAVYILNKRFQDQRNREEL